MRGLGALLLHILAGFAGAAVLLGLGSHGVSAHSALAHSGKSLPTAQLFPPNMRSEQADAVEVQAAFGRLPLHFEAHGEKTFLARAPGYTLILRPSEALVVVDRPNTETSRTTTAAPQDVRMQLLGAARELRAEGLEPLPGKINYLLGDDPGKWRTGIATYKKVQHHSVYPGIDLVYYGNPNKLEFDFVVAPGSQPETIQLTFRGIQTSRIDSQGSLVLGAEEAIRLHAPVLYQEFEGERRPVDGRYLLERQTASDGKPVQVSFAVGDYDATRPLVIDPVLDFSSYLGWAGAEAASDIARDDSGNLYITGRTNSSAGPGVKTSGPRGNRDIFVAKLDSTGSVLKYMTFLGGSLDDGVAAIDVNAFGQAALGGSTASTDFPKTYGAFSKTNSGANDGFVVQLDADGFLNYGSYLGGSGQDSVADVFSTMSNSQTKISVTGNTGSTNFPVKNEDKATLSGQTDVFVASIVVSNVNSPVNGCILNGIAYHDCDDLDYSTYLGGGSFDAGQGILVDGVDTYVTGQTCSIDFPATSTAFATSHVGACDAFVTILDGNPISVDYSTYLGGTIWELGRALALSPSPNEGIFVIGETSSADFPVRNAVQSHLGGGAYDYDVFVTRILKEPYPNNAAAPCTLNGIVYNDCTEFMWSSFLGGSDADYGHDVVLAPTGEIFVTGQTCSADFPLSAPLTQDLVQGINVGASCDAFVSKFSSDGSALEYSTYLGGSADDSGAAIVIGPLADAYVVGSTHSNDFPTQSAFQATAGGGGDGFVSKLTIPCIGGGGPFVYLLPEAIDTEGNCLVDSGSPSKGGFEGIDVSPSSSSGGHGAKIFSASGETVWFIDPVNQQSNEVTQLPINPNQMASNLKGTVLSPDATRLYVADHCDNTPCYVHVFDTESELAIDSLPWPDAVTENGNVGALGAAIHPNGEKLYLANEHDAPHLYAIDIATKVATGIPANAAPWELKVTPDGKWVYAVGDNGVDVIDATTDTHSVHIDAMNHPSLKDARNLAITPEPVFPPDGYLVYVTAQGPGDLTVIRTDTHTVLQTIPGVGDNAVSITPDGTKAYVNAAGFVKVIDVANHQWVENVMYLVGSQAMIGDYMGPDDTDADGIIDQVDSDANNFSNGFSDGTSNGAIVDRADQFVSVWDAFEDGLYANARGGTQTANIQACNFDIFLDQNDAVKLICGSLTLEVFSGQAEIGLGDEHYAAVPEGGEVKVEATGFEAERAGDYRLQNLGDETVSVIDAAGSVVGSVSPGEAQLWPSFPSSTWLVQGIAEGGGLLLDILGIELEVATFAGQSAGQVAYAIADAIRAEPSLLGVQSTVTGDFIVITAPVDDVYSGDGGIQISVPSAIPALSPSLIALLGFAMLALGYRGVRNRSAR